MNARGKSDAFDGAVQYDVSAGAAFAFNDLCFEATPTAQMQSRLQESTRVLNISDAF
jgi:hypothetical protein